jgi:hypothetical protein
MATQSEKLRKANQTRIDSFFDSFSVTRIAVPETEPVNLPEDFLVSLVGRRHSSKFFGSSMEIPEDWIMLDQEESNYLMELGKDLIKEKDPKIYNRMTEVNNRVLGVFSRTSPSEGMFDGMMFVIAEKAPYPNFLPLSVAKTYIQLYLDPAEKVTIGPSTTQIDKVEFAWVETYDSEAKLYHRIYFANRRGISFEISMSYKNQSELELMLASLRTLRFDDVQK